MRITRILWLLVVLGISGCAAREVLETRNAIVPPGVDFSGNWVIRSDSADDHERINREISRAAGADSGIIPLPPDKRETRNSSARRGSRKNRGGLVQVFLESGRHLKVTQTADGIFISFDRSVVEEYRFGENREVSIGEIVAQRVSGWDGDRYVVETLDRNGMKLTEQLYLSDDGETLHRLIVLRKPDAADVTLRQSFARDTES